MESLSRCQRAAILYIQSKVDEIWAIGNYNGGRGPSNEAMKKFLVSMYSVPSEAIKTIPGIDTFQQVQTASEKLVGNEEVYAVTSWWHQPRALLLLRWRKIRAKPVTSWFPLPSRFLDPIKELFYLLATAVILLLSGWDSLGRILSPIHKRRGGVTI